MRIIATAAIGLLAVTPLQAQDGAGIYESNCAVCHEAGLDRAPDRATLDLMAPDRILYALERGAMVSMAVTLSTDQRRSVSEFLSGESLSGFSRRPPESAFCRNAGGDFRAGSPDWQGWSGTGLGNHRYQNRARAGITPANVAELEVAWAFGFPGDIRAYSPPTIANGRLFLGSLGGGVYSLDAQTGCVYWFLDVGASVRSPMTIATIMAGGREREAVFFGDGTAIAYAVDTASGAIIWQTEVDDFPVAHISGSTVYHDGKLFVATGSGEEGAAASPDYECCRFRGSISALDASTGEVLWKTYSVAEPQRQSRNAVGTQLWGPSGAPIWSSPAVDPERNAVYVTTGNNYSNPASDLSDAFIALDIDSGSVLWSQQMTAGDAWTAACRLEDKTNCANLTAPDFDFAASPILVDRPDGSSLLIAGQKSGVVHALDPDRRGAVVWQTRVGLGGSMGGVQWGSATDGEKVYVAISDVRRIPVQHSWATEADPEIGGGVVALDLDDGSLQWFTQPKPCGDRLRCSPAQPGAVTVIDGVAFAGSMTGFLRAYDTDDGSVLWEFDSVRSFETVNGVQAAGGAIDGAGPTIANGMLYLNSGYPNGGGMPGNVLIALSVGGN